MTLPRVSLGSIAPPTFWSRSSRAQSRLSRFVGRASTLVVLSVLDAATVPPTWVERNETPSTGGDAGRDMSWRGGGPGQNGVAALGFGEVIFVASSIERVAASTLSFGTGGGTSAAASGS